MIYLAVQSTENRRVKIAEIAKNTDSPVAFTAKILGQLTKDGLVYSQTGPNGGFYLKEEELQGIRVIQIVESIDGDSIFNGCGLGLSECNPEMPCPMHEKFVVVRGQLKKMLLETTVNDLMRGLKSGATNLLR